VVFAQQKNQQASPSPDSPAFSSPTRIIWTAPRRRNPRRRQHHHHRQSGRLPGQRARNPWHRPRSMMRSLSMSDTFRSQPRRAQACNHRPRSAPPCFAAGGGLQKTHRLLGVQNDPNLPRLRDERQVLGPHRCGRASTVEKEPRATLYRASVSFIAPKPVPHAQEAHYEMIMSTYCAPTKSFRQEYKPQNLVVSGLVKKKPPHDPLHNLCSRSEILASPAAIAVAQLALGVSWCLPRT